MDINVPDASLNVWKAILFREICMYMWLINLMSSQPLFSPLVCWPFSINIITKLHCKTNGYNEKEWKLAILLCKAWKILRSDKDAESDHSSWKNLEGKLKYLSCTECFFFFPNIYSIFLLSTLYKCSILFTTLVQRHRSCLYCLLFRNLGRQSLFIR